MTPHSLQQIDLGSVTVSGTNSARLVAFAPLQILQVGCVITTATTVAASVITGAYEAATGAALSPVTGTFGFTMTIPVAAINTGVYLDVSATGRRILYPGESLELLSDGGSTAGAARFFALVDLLGMGSDADLRNGVVGHPGSTTNATALAALTKVTA